MPPALLAAAEAAGATLLAVAALRLARRPGLLARIRFALVALGLLGAVLLLEGQLRHPGREAIFRAALAAAVLVAVHLVLQVGDHVVWERILRPRHVAIPRLLFDVLHALVLAGVAVALLKVLWGFNLTGILVTSTVLSAIVGLSLQDVLSSLMAGIALQMEGPFAPRDWVRIGDKEGEVVQMSWRTVTLRSRDGHHVVLPNARAAREDLLNFSRPGPSVMLHATVGVAYGHPPGEVKAVLAPALAGAKGVEPFPPAQALVSGFGESAVEYDLRFFTRDLAGAAAVRDAALSRAWYALRRAGFAIPFPQREVAVRQVGDGEASEALERRRTVCWEALRGVATFGPLSDEQVRGLARHARLERYTEGETLVRQGDEGRSLFVVRSGEVRVEREEGGLPRELARLGTGDFFGEMALLTGESRSASVVAASEVEVAVVGMEALSPLLHEDGHLARALSEVLEERTRQTALSSAGEATVVPRAAADPSTFLLRIQRFFGLEV